MIGRLLQRLRRVDPVVLPGRDIQTPERPQIESRSRAAVETGRVRLLVSGGIVLAAFAVVGLRLVDVSVIEAGRPAHAAASVARPAVASARADILDRNGVLLATSLPTVSLYANAREILDAQEAAAKLVSVLPDLRHAEVLERLTSGRPFIYLYRHLTPRQQAAVNRLGIPGVYFEKGERRVYPHGAAAAHVVGLTDVDNIGIAGVEKTFDDRLRRQGLPLRLSMDIRAQGILRAELAAAMETHRAVGAAGVLLDARSAEVLALASLPDFDPNNPGRASADAIFNRATLGVVEMGSTFKLLTAAVALDAGVVGLEDGYDASKPLRVARFTINDSHPENRWLSVPEIIVHSSNIGAAKMGRDVGGERQRAFLESLGLLDPSPVELPEVGRPLVPSPWREINTMTISYGHGVAVTPLQMANAIAAIANGGIYRPATLLPRPAAAYAGARVVEPATSAAVRHLMRLVVEEGTGRQADVPGYRVGGKTGTAEKLGPDGRYRRKALVSSFVAAFPVDAPRYVLLVMLDEPKGTEATFGWATGGWTAAPAAGRIVARLAPLLGVPPLRLPPTPREERVAAAQ